MFTNTTNSTSIRSYPNLDPSITSRKRKLNDLGQSDVSVVSTATFAKNNENYSSHRIEKKKKVSKESSPQFNFIFDQYTEARGEPQMLEITCRKCNAWCMDYQKDGLGRLLRCYVDRIYHPSALRNKVFTQRNLKNTSNLSCVECSTSLAEPIIYKRQYPKPEIRPAYRILNDNLNGKQIPRILIKKRQK